ncbi:MAG: histone deacetylase family protein [Candidatus Asgardarchaeia archaeon]
MSTGLFFSKECLLHDPGFDHPERKERIEYTLNFIRNIDFKGDLKFYEGKCAKVKDILLVHEKEYFELIREISESDGGFLDSDTIVSKGTLKSAMYAVGTCLYAAKKIMRGEVKNAFALIRPPGHHATWNRGGGFCFFNNIAIVARYLIKEGFKRIVIVDWDAHHGNGTQEIFYKNPKVFYMGLHQDGRTLYPGTGFINEMGAGEGEGFNLNFPFPPFSLEHHYTRVFKEVLIPVMEEYKPQFILISAGYDGHYLDTISNIFLKVQSFGYFTEYLKEISDRFSSGKMLAILEGGYVLRPLAEGISNTLSVMSGSGILFKDNIKLKRKNSVERIFLSKLSLLKDKLKNYWRI